MKDDWYNYSPDEANIVRATHEYYKLISKCNTDAEKSASWIHNLQINIDNLRDDKNNLIEQLKSEKKRYLKLDRLLDNALKSLNSYENKSIFILIKERFIIWLLGEEKWITLKKY